MDAVTRKRKLEELETWKRNLALAQNQAALSGMSPPIALTNEIETAQRNVERIERELDAGTEASTEQSVISLFELLLILTRRVDEIRAQMKTLRRTSNPTLAAKISRWTAFSIVGALYTSFMIKEIRDVIIANPLAAALIIVLFAILAGLLFLLSGLLKPPESSQ